VFGVAAWIAFALANAKQPGTPASDVSPPEPAGGAIVRLALDAPSPRGTWTLRVVNEGDRPGRFIADARLLVLEVTPRGAHGPVRCELPPSGDLSDYPPRTLVLAPGASFEGSFEPRMYCFGPALNALSGGAVVVAQLGTGAHPPRSRSSPPRRAKTRAGQSEPPPLPSIGKGVAFVRALVAPPVALPDEPTPVATTTDLAPEDDETPKLALFGALAVDAASGDEIEVPVTLRNEGMSPVTVRFRPDVLGFDVTGPNGSTRCTWPTLPSAPTREVFTTISPSKESGLTLTLRAYCAPDTFARPGMYLVKPWLDTRVTSAGGLGVDAFSGRVVATSGTFVRVQRGKIPLGFGASRSASR